MISTADLIGQLLAVLDEAFKHPPKRSSYFIDNMPGAGLLETLCHLSAAEASQKVAGTSIAAHTYHLAYALRASAAWISGDAVQVDWRHSWSVDRVDDEAWTRVIDDLREAYRTTRRAIDSHAAAGIQPFGGSIGAIAHTAYHMGAIRQKLAIVKQST